MSETAETVWYRRNLVNELQVALEDQSKDYIIGYFGALLSTHVPPDVLQYHIDARTPKKNLDNGDLS